jgi:hypothetical protein
VETPRPAPRFFAALLLLGAVLGCGASDADAPPRGTLSLLAVGDTGQPVTALTALDPGHAVAAAMAEEDARAPVDAVVLLGDNFYPDGLEEDELKDRLRENLVGPFCRFVALTPRGAGSLREACPEARALHPVPIYAVLGNHDYGERESPDLQRKLVPEYVSSWRMPAGDVEVQELEGGVSLVLIDSNRVGRDDGGDREVVRALRRSRGPWRVIAAHHPMPDVGRGYDARFERRMGELIAAAGVPIHVYLAGHEHNLQALAGEAPGPALHLVAGGGSDVRELGEGDPRRRFGSASLGFARIDVHDGPRPRLVASLHEVPAPPLPRRARPAARFEVLESGEMRALAPEAEGP